MSISCKSRLLAYVFRQHCSLLCPDLSAEGIKYVDLETSFTDFNQTKPVAAPLQSETHSGSDVGIFATGTLRCIYTCVGSEPKTQA
jgi:hypothetical protein